MPLHGVGALSSLRGADSGAHCAPYDELMHV
jgi:hypothetical protein